MTPHDQCTNPTMVGNHFQFCPPGNPKLLHVMSRQQPWEKEISFKRAGLEVSFEGIQTSVKFKDQKGETMTWLWLVVIVAAME